MNWTLFPQFPCKHSSPASSVKWASQEIPTLWNCISPIKKEASLPVPVCVSPPSSLGPSQSLTVPVAISVLHIAFTVCPLQLCFSALLPFVSFYLIFCLSFPSPSFLLLPTFVSLSRLFQFDSFLFFHLLCFSLSLPPPHFFSVFKPESLSASLIILLSSSSCFILTSFSVFFCWFASLSLLVSASAASLSLPLSCCLSLTL